MIHSTMFSADAPEIAALEPAHLSPAVDRAG